MSRLFFPICALFIAMSLASPVAQEAPSSIELDGGVTLPLAAQARRTHLLGSIEFYQVRIYANGSLHDAAALASTSTPKALRIDVSYAEDIRQSVTFDWQRELIPGLETPAITQLRRIFAPLRAGDVVQIDYTRTKGTTIRVNRDVAVSRGSHEVMLAFLDHWIGQRPMSEEMKQALLR